MKIYTPTSFKWVMWQMFIMGLLFMGIATVIFLCVPHMPFAFRLVFLVGFGGMGLIMFTIGAVIGVKNLQKKRLQRRLIEEGNYIWANVVDVTPNNAVNIYGRAPIVLECEYQHPDGQVYSFKSGYLNFDPMPMLTDNRVKVWVNPNNFKKYYMDIEDS